MGGEQRKLPFPKQRLPTEVGFMGAHDHTANAQKQHLLRIPMQASLGETRMSSRAELLEALEPSFPVSGDCFISWLQHGVFKSLSDFPA